MAAVAAHKQISIDGMHVRIEGQTRKQSPASAAFQVEIELSPELTQRERTILYNSARSCDVSKILTGDTSFTYKLALSESAQ